MSSVFFMVLNISLKMGKKWLITTKVYFVVVLNLSFWGYIIKETR